MPKTWLSSPGNNESFKSYTCSKMKVLYPFLRQKQWIEKVKHLCYVMIPVKPGPKLLQYYMYNAKKGQCFAG